MRRALLLSIFIHLVVIFVTVMNFPELLFPEPEARIVNVKLIAAADPAKSIKKKKPKKIKTQQSAAPKSPPKKQKKKAPPTPKHDTKVVTAKAEKKVKKKKPEKKKAAPKPKKDEPKPISRPAKLDKTKNKKNIVESRDKDAEIAKTPDDFLQTLDFIDKLKKNQKVAHIQDKDETPPQTVTMEDQRDIALIKRHIEKNWYRPPGIKGLDALAVQIELRLNRDGTLSDMTLMRSSGEQFFDNSILRAVRKSVPLPIPSDKYDLFKVIDLRFNG